MTESQQRHNSNGTGSAPPPGAGPGEHARAPATDAPAEELAEEIHDISPEGLPAHPEAGPSQIGIAITLGAVTVVAAGILTGLLFRPLIGAGIVAIGLALLFANPSLWASVLRARERSRAQRRVRQKARLSGQGGAVREGAR